MPYSHLHNSANVSEPGLLLLLRVGGHHRGVEVVFLRHSDLRVGEEEECEVVGGDSQAVHYVHRPLQERNLVWRPSKSRVVFRVLELNLGAVFCLSCNWTHSVKIALWRRCRQTGKFKLFKTIENEKYL